MRVDYGRKKLKGNGMQWEWLSQELYVIKQKRWDKQCEREIVKDQGMWPLKVSLRKGNSF